MNSNSEIFIFNSVERLAEYLGATLKKEREKISSERKLNLALSGGSTPKKIFQYWSENFKDEKFWNSINFFWADERCVPPDDEDSNYGMTKKILFDNLSIPTENIFRIAGEKNPREEARNYSAKIFATLPKKNFLPKFDVIFLGLGEDGHTASIFPDSLKLFESKKICETAAHPATGQKRITLTGSTINNADNIFFIVTGESKAEIVEQILNKSDDLEKYPASRVNPNEGSIFWLLDESAAKKI